MSSRDNPPIQDPGEFNQRRRLKEIADARSFARRLYTELALEDAPDAGDAKAFFAAVQAYLTELEWLIRDHGGEVYHTRQLGTIDIPPPGELLDFSENRILSGDRSARSFTVVGLVSPAERPTWSFRDLSSKMGAEWSVKVDVRHEGPQELHYTNEAHVPIAVSMDAFSLLNRFVKESGIDARIEDERDFTHYSE